MIEPGQQFGLYVIKSVAEVSGTQTRCCAEDPFFNREVLLKIYAQDQFFGLAQLEQFETLLETLSVLDHPSIAPVYDSGFEGDEFYYTSALYSGGSLGLRLQQDIPGTQALKIVAELAQALDYAFVHELGHGEVSAEKIFFDSNQRAVLVGFGIDSGLNRIAATGCAFDPETAQQELTVSVSESLRSLGDLLLQMLLGPMYNSDERIEDQVASIGVKNIRLLVGRFLLPGEVRFASFTELLKELGSFEGVYELLKEQTVVPSTATIDSISVAESDKGLDEEQKDEVVAEVRRLVVEKNDLQQALDKALYERNLAGNKQVEGERQLEQAKQAISKAKEEASVAWELVAGQRYDRWRPAAWAVGGFVIGFLLSGSYGYYYSEQTRDELLAKLKANEELIKTATWRPVEPAPRQVSQVSAPPVLANNLPQGPSEASGSEALVLGAETEAAVETEVQQVATLQVLPVAEETKNWWPAGNEFSVTAAIPMEKIKAALGLRNQEPQGALADGLQQEVLATVQRWAESWAQQDLSNYFSYYSDSYLPELGRSQQQWREMRSSRLQRPEWIKLDINDIRVRKISEDRIQVKLRQSYRSDYYQDEVLKSINLIKEDGRWRILMERSLGMVSHSDIVGG